jgi:hypothetical protein
MSGASTIPAYTGGSRQVAERKSGLGSVLVIAIVGVLAIGVLALVLGFTGSNNFIDNIRDKIPGLRVDDKDGWEALDDPSGGFVAQMPEDREKNFVAFPAAANGRLDQWSSVIGHETDLTISYGNVSRPEGQSAKAALATYADAWAAGMGGRVQNLEETGFAGYNAVVVNTDRLTYDNQTATARGLMVLKGDTLYVIQSESIYPDHPQYERLVHGFQFTQ